MLRFFLGEKLYALNTYVDTQASSGMRADMSTCPCVRIHRGVNENPQQNGERANVSHMSAEIVGDDIYVVSN